MTLCNLKLGIALIVLGLGLCLPTALVLFLVGYVPEAYKEQNYRVGVCNVVVVQAMEQRCVSTSANYCGFAGVSILSWYNAYTLRMVTSSATTSQAFRTHAEALNHGSALYGEANVSFQCWYDMHANESRDATKIMQLDAPNSVAYMISGCAFLGVVIALIAVGGTLVFVHRHLHAARCLPAAAASIPRIITTLQPSPSNEELTQRDMDASIDIDDENACIICCAHRANAVFSPCNHRFTCMGCAQYFLEQPCGYCRQPVSSIRRLDLGTEVKPHPTTVEETVPSSEDQVSTNEA